MENNKKYYLYVNNEKIEVSYEIYKSYYAANRKEYHIMKELKEGRKRVNSVTKEVIYLPSLETSYEWMQEIYGDTIETGTLGPEEMYIHKELMNRLYEALDALNDEDRELIIKLFFKGKTENELAKERGLSVKTINYHKRRILSKLQLFFQ